MRRGRGVAGAVVVLALAPAASGTAAARPDAACGFGTKGYHRISQRTHITCVGVKHVLLGLRGVHALVPMVCGETRWVGHWKVTAVRREEAAIVNRFSRGSVSFVYKRHQKPQDAAACLPR